MIARENVRRRLSDPKAVAEVFREILAAEDELDRDKEHFWGVGLDRKNGIKYIDLVSLGTLGHTVVHPRETFRPAIRMGGINAILCAHNHPSNDTTPSGEDIRLTEILKKAGEVVGIELLDHVIVGANGHTSMRDLGFL